MKALPIVFTCFVVIHSCFFRDAWAPHVTPHTSHHLTLRTSTHIRHPLSRSLMHLAPIHGDAAMVKMLADNGCESNMESSLHHFFPLHVAAMTTPFPSSGAKADIKVSPTLPCFRMLFCSSQLPGRQRPDSGGNSDWGPVVGPRCR